VAIASLVTASAVVFAAEVALSPLVSAALAAFRTDEMGVAREGSLCIGEICRCRGHLVQVGLEGLSSAWGQPHHFQPPDTKLSSD
jgi:hypothetical protein